MIEDIKRFSNCSLKMYIEYSPPPPRSRRFNGRAEGSKLYVGRVPYYTTRDDFMEMFGRFGFIDQVDIVPERHAAFIHYSHPFVAHNVVKWHGGCIRWRDVDLIIEVSHSLPRKSGACFLCRAMDHWARDCPQKTRSDKRKSSCFRCGQKNHIAKYCHNYYSLASLPDGRQSEWLLSPYKYWINDCNRYE